MKVARLLVLGAMFSLLDISQSQLTRAQAAPDGPAAGAEDITPTEEPGAWGWLKKPSFTMPKVSFPKMPADPLAPIKSSAKKVSDGTKRAWEGTKEIFTFGGPKEKPQQQPTRVASAGEPPSIWQRMFGGDEAKKNEGPATVGEWMNQPRVE
jgi:hypothetical protein